MSTNKKFLDVRNFWKTMDDLEEDICTGIMKHPYERVEIEWEIRLLFDFVKPKATLVENKYSNIFDFGRSPWQLRLLKGEEIFDFFSLQLYGASHPDPIEYKFGLKRLDGKVEILVSGVLEECTFESERHAVRISDIPHRKNERTLEGALTIVCILKRGTVPTLKSSDKGNFRKLEMWDIVSKNCKALLADEDSCDTTLQVGDKQYKAHRIILISRSSVFAAMFKDNTSLRQTGLISITDCNSYTFHDFLTFLYTGKLNIVSFFQAVHLYQMSDKYDVQDLKESCLKHLMQRLTTEKLCFIAHLADAYEETALFSRVQNVFNGNTSKILESSEWQFFMEQNPFLANQLLKKYALQSEICRLFSAGNRF